MALFSFVQLIVFTTLLINVLEISGIQHNTLSITACSMKKCAARHNDNQNNATRCNYCKSPSLMSFMQAVAIKSIMLRVVMLNVMVSIFQILRMFMLDSFKGKNWNARRVYYVSLKAKRY